MLLITRMSYFLSSTCHRGISLFAALSAVLDYDATGTFDLFVDIDATALRGWRLSSTRQ